MQKRTHAMVKGSRSSGSRCTVEIKQGCFCDAPAYEGMPFPICQPHALRVAAAIWGEVRDRLDARPSHDEEEYQQQVQISLTPKRKVKAIGTECVYYVALGEHIKIGYTANIKRRMTNAYQTGELLVTEAGGRGLERKRLHEFREYLDAGQEWFQRGLRLMAHIDSLKGVTRDTGSKNP